MTRYATPFVVADVVDRANMRVIERGDDLGFAIESFARAGVVVMGGLDDLDGDEAIEAPIAGAIHLSHPAELRAAQGCRMDRDGHA